MRGGRGYGFYPVKIIFEFESVRFFARNDFGLKFRFAEIQLTDFFTRGFVFADLFSDNIARPGKFCGNVIDPFFGINKCFGFCLNVDIRLLALYDFSQWFQAFFAGYCCTGTTFGPVWQINILQRSHRRGFFNLLFQFIGQ